MEWNGNEFASKTFVCLDSSYTIFMSSVTDCFHVPFLVTLHYPTPNTQFQNCIYIFIVLEVLNNNNERSLYGCAVLKGSLGSRYRP